MGRRGTAWLSGMPARHCARYPAPPSLTAPIARFATHSFHLDWEAYDRHIALFRDSGVDVCQERNLFCRQNLPFPRKHRGLNGYGNDADSVELAQKGGYGPGHAYHDSHEAKGGVTHVRDGLDSFPLKLWTENLQLRP